MRKPRRTSLSAPTKSREPAFRKTMGRSGRHATNRSEPDEVAGPNGRGMPGGVVQLRTEVRRLTADLDRAHARIAELEALAETDVLLDIPNRRGFERELTRAIAYLGRYRASAALIALDVDGLKPVNDSCGHAAGDAVLKGIVEVVQRQIRSSDMLARLGGDEFAVLLWNLGETDARAKAASLEAAIDRLTVVFGGRPLGAGASTGVTMVAASDEVAAALDRADQEMYRRKALRRARG